MMEFPAAFTPARPSSEPLRPIDSNTVRTQGDGMNRKPDKAAETAAAYTAAKPEARIPARNASEPGVRSADVSEVRKNRCCKNWPNEWACLPFREAVDLIHENSLREFGGAEGIRD
jgi:hypothetical protein